MQRYFVWYSFYKFISKFRQDNEFVVVKETQTHKQNL